MAHHSFLLFALISLSYPENWSIRSYSKIYMKRIKKDFPCMDFREKRREKLLFELSNAADSSKKGTSALRFQREKDSKRVTGHSSYCSSSGVVPDGCSTFTFKEPPVRSHETRIIPDGVGTSPEA